MTRRSHITDARQVAEATGARQCIVLCFYGPEAGPQLAGRVSGSSYGTTRQQVARIGNSVPPAVVEALVRAQFGGGCTAGRMAA